MKTSVVLCMVVLLGASRAAKAAPAPDVSGDWELAEQIFGNSLGARLELKSENGSLSGTLFGRGKKTVTGTATGDHVQFGWKDEDGTVAAYEGRVSGATMSGTVTHTGEKWAPTPPSPWTAKRPATDRPAAPRTLD